MPFQCLTPYRAAQLSLDLYQQTVSAGFPSPTEGYVKGKLDLNLHLTQNPSMTSYVKIPGDSMIGAGIHCGDLLVVDRSLEPTLGRSVIAVLNGELTVNRLQIEADRLVLRSENEHYPSIEVRAPEVPSIWGVATSTIHLL